MTHLPLVKLNDTATSNWKRLDYEPKKRRWIWWELAALDWRRQWRPTPALLPGKSYGRRSLVGCSPWSRWGSDTTERLRFHFSLSCIGEGNGNPLQCYCLENPRDGGAWWAAVYGVAQSWTRLKRLSSNGYNVECIFMSLLVICIFYSEKCLLKSFAHFLIGLFGVFCCCWVVYLLGLFYIHLFCILIFRVCLL